MLANQLDEAVADTALGVALSIGLDVAQVTNVTVRISRGTVALAVWVVFNQGFISFALLLSSYLWGFFVRKRRRGETGAYSEGQRWCSRWCCHRIDGRAFHARRWRHGQ